MTNNPIIKYYWGIGLENETYFQLEEWLEVSGQFIQEKMGRERYSINYLTCYRNGAIDACLRSAFDPEKKYKVSRMINSHSLEKLDIHYQHKTLLSKTPDQPNPEYAGKSILETFLEQQPHSIQSLLTQKNNPNGPIIFDGDTIEFVTKYFENRTVEDTCRELLATKKLFLEKLNVSKVMDGHLAFPDYNVGINMFMSNQKNLVLFNNGTFHFHFTLPTLTADSRITDYPAFDKAHQNAIYLLQWLEPLFICTLGSPDIMGVISKKHGLQEQFACGSMRNAMSRYTGVGTYHHSMAKGKILTYPVEDFRKLLHFKKEDNIWWRDQIENTLSYELLNDLGLDFNREKLYQSGFEVRSFDEFPTTSLPAVLQAIILVCEHSLSYGEIQWASNDIAWNNVVFKALKDGHAAIISIEEQQTYLNLFNLPTLLGTVKTSMKMDAFFFSILSALHDQYKEQNQIMDLLLGGPADTAPHWENFNEYQVNQHMKQLNPVES